MSLQQCCYCRDHSEVPSQWDTRTALSPLQQVVSLIKEKKQRHAFIQRWKYKVCLSLKCSLSYSTSVYNIITSWMRCRKGVFAAVWDFIWVERKKTRWRLLKIRVCIWKGHQCSPAAGCVSEFSAGDSSVFPFPVVFCLALDFLPDFSPSSKYSSAVSTVPIKESSSRSLVCPLFPAFFFLRDAGVLALADSEVEDEAGVEGGVLDNWGSAEQRSLFRSCSLTKSCSWLLTPAHLRDKRVQLTAAALHEDFRKVHEDTLVANKLCGPLTAFIFHESLQGQKISQPDPIYNRYSYNLNNTILTIVALIKIHAKAVYIIQNKNAHPPKTKC